MADTSDYARILVGHYQNLLELYKRLEVLSGDVFEALGDKSMLGNIQEKLRQKMRIVEDIQKESQKIAALKMKLRLSESERMKVRKAEETLTAVVSRVIEQEDKSRELLKKQGVKISKR